MRLNFRDLGLSFVAGCFFLAGCQFLDTADTKIRENLVKVCGVLETAHDTYTDLLPVVPIEQKYKDAIQAAYDPAHKTCLTPETATTLKVVTDVIAAGVRIYAIITQVTQANPAAMEVIAE